MDFPSLKKLSQLSAAILVAYENDGLKYFCVFLVSLETIGINSEKCIDYGK